MGGTIVAAADWRHLLDTWEALIPDRLKNKVALVTGGSSGIGRAAAQLFVREGAKVVVADVNGEGGEATLKSIRETGGDAHFVRTDISNAAEVKALIDKIIELHGRLDCAYNNAGIFGELLSVIDHDETTWNQAIETLPGAADVVHHGHRDQSQGHLAVHEI